LVLLASEKGDEINRQVIRLFLYAVQDVKVGTTNKTDNVWLRRVRGMLQVAHYTTQAAGRLQKYDTAFIFKLLAVTFVTSQLLYQTSNAKTYLHGA
jgi:hypothetical protein